VLKKHGKHILALVGKEKCVTLIAARPAKPYKNREQWSSETISKNGAFPKSHTSRKKVAFVEVVARRVEKNAIV
jgi:hypothetical protein